MKYTFRLRDRQVTLAALEPIAAVRPQEELRKSLSRSELRKRFGATARDDSRGGPTGLVLPARNRRVFERAGWMFVEASRVIADAAATRSPVDGARVVRRVYLGRAGMSIATDRVTVQLEADVSADEAVARMHEDGLAPVHRLGFAANLFEARVPEGRSELEVVQELQARTGRYRFVEPVLLEAIGGRRTPNDPEFGNQWHHRNEGVNGALAGADLRSEEAWELTLGQGVRVAVVDSEFHVNHPDLKSGIVGGGYFTDGAGGTRFTRWRPGDVDFPKGPHGTLCLSMAGARMDNNRGGCGMAPGCDLLAVACLTDQLGTQTTLARAIAYAADPSTEDPQADRGDGAHVISCSLGPNGAHWPMTSTLELAIQRAAAWGRGGLGVPIFWATTNGAFNIEGDEVCSHPDVLAVSSSNWSDRAGDGGYGRKLEFVAPGIDVFGASSASGYGFYSGCSLAAPLAAGVAALVLSRQPDWSRDQVRERLRASCDKIGGVAYAGGRHDHYGYGRINARLAVQ